MCFKFVILRNVIFRDFKNPVNFVKMYCAFALCGQYTIGFLNSINVLRDKTLNSVCALDRVLPFHSKFFSMSDWSSFVYLVYITHGMNNSSVCLSERL